MTEKALKKKSGQIRIRIMTKRCKNCGWPNDDNAIVCEKCSAPLENGQSPRPVAQTVSESGEENLRKTVSESQFFGGSEPQFGHENENREVVADSDRNLSSCPNCGYPVRNNMAVCPDCGTVLREESNRCPKCGTVNQTGSNFCHHCGSSLESDETRVSINNGGHSHQGTVNPWMQPSTGTFCTLKPISWAGENIDHQPLSFSGVSIVLNRSNTDPNNQSITSTEQAELSFEEGEWYIIDKSQQRTTYVLAARKTKLHKGDIIVLGNRLFEFN